MFPNMTKEERAALVKRISQVMSEILSDQYDAKITVVYKEVEDVPGMQDESVPSTVSVR